MKLVAWKLYFTLRNLIERQEGQDLVEYALVVALIALAATAGMNALASGINSAFTNVSTTLANDISTIL